ncbi:MAG: AmmeMemoRadiSam system protein B [Candidatus Omnitrophica bacterium]|nr:AmmeMemoRadiSam system protein B [Candidatus Omnitrophota bacterium]
MMVREPTAAGQFYPASAEALKEMIASMVDEDAQKEKAIGVISPHAGYPFSGPCAGAVFSRIEIPPTVVLLGPNHTGTGANFSLYNRGSWRTPLGDVEVDSELAGMISKSTDLIDIDEKAHDGEHCLEVQLPFIQYFKEDFKIVPILLGSGGLDKYNELGNAIASSIKSSDKDALIIASGDMTHYEPQGMAVKKDKIAIDAVLRLDAGELLDKVEEHNISMCGSISAAVMVIAAKILGAETAELVKYQTSGETTGDFSAVVGYASMIIR